MIPASILLLSLLGILLNLSLSGLVLQPDWSAALLLASVLAQRGNWPWVIPGFWVHDLALHWSSLICLPVVAILPFLLSRADAHLGAGLPQRVVLMIITLLPLLHAGWSTPQWLMTICICIFVWHLLARSYAKSH
jgi:hypothetical protein